MPSLFLSGLLTAPEHIDRTKGTGVRAPIHSPVGRQALLAAQENRWVRGKEEKSVGFGAVWSQAGRDVGRTDAGPNCTSILSLR